MPAMSGVELTAAMTAEGPRLKVLLMSGFAEDVYPQGGVAFSVETFHRLTNLRSGCGDGAARQTYVVFGVAAVIVRSENW